MDEELEVNHSLDDVIEQYMKSKPEGLEDDSDEDETEALEEEPTDDESDEGDEEEASEESDEDAEEGEAETKPEPKSADDDAEVTVSVDGKELKVPVKELKRLYGQEASLTQKSQAVSAQARAVETQGLYLAKILSDRFELATAKAAKYKDVDLFRAMRELEPDEFDALRSAKEAAEVEVKALEVEANEFMKRAQQTRANIIQEKAKASLKEITKAIPEWNDALYGEIRTYAISQGMDRDTVNEVVDAGAIIMMHKALQFDKATTASEKVVKKVVKAPQKVAKKANSVADAPTRKAQSKLRLAASSGDIDDIADAFLATHNS